MVKTNDKEVEEIGNPQVRVCEINRADGSCGFNLTKSKWDPYPWVSTVESGSPAEMAGVQPGDCLLEVNGEDVLGLRVTEVGNRVRSRDEKVVVMLWNAGVDPKCTPEALCCGPMPANLKRLSSCMNNILAALECPICLDTIPPPAHQCTNGHLICISCRVRMERCPVCRMKFFRGRSLLADQVFNSLIDAFDLRDKEESELPKMLKQKLCGQQKANSKKPDIKVNFLSTPANKFLKRVMGSGKSTSAENLSETSRLQSASSNLSIPLDNDFYSGGLKAKSLSSNEIFQTDESQHISRATSVLSNRPGSGLLDVRPFILSKRPASYHGSSDDLQSRLFADFGTELEASKKEKSCNCPCDPVCNKQVNVSSVMKHIQEWHDGPIVHYFKPKIDLDIPLPYPSTTVIAVAAFNNIFIVKTLDYNFEKEDNRLWVWSVNGREKYTAFVVLQSDNRVEITLECAVESLATVGWQQACNSNCGILLKPSDKYTRLELEIKHDSQK